MKRLVLFLSLFQLAAAVTAQSPIDVLHYRYQLALNDQNDSIQGVAIIRFRALENAATVMMDLAGISKQNGKGMLVTTAGLMDKPTAATFRQENDRVIVNTPVKSGDTVQLVINYKGIPQDGLIISKNKYGHRTFFSDNWPNRAHQWIPCHDDPADKASVEFSVVAPSHYQVVSNGVLVEESNWKEGMRYTTWREDIPLPTKVMVIAAADFAVSYAGRVGCVEVSSWVFPENRKEGFDDYAMARELLAYHEKYIGAFPYKKLANVQSKTVFGGMENAGAIFYYENSVTGTGKEEALLSHEIVHQWFGDMATEKSFAHLWLSEGFATYLTHMYIESKYGADSLRLEMKKDRDQVLAFVRQSKKPVVDTTSEWMELLNANSYQKGSWVLHMLRRKLGDVAFQKAIRLYYETYKGANADTRDLQRVFESVTGQSLATFFQQWLYTGENLQLEMGWKYDAVKKELVVQVRQTQPTVFAFPLTVGIKGSSGDMVLEQLEITTREKEFLIPLKNAPAGVVADPAVSLLFEGKMGVLK